MSEIRQSTLNPAVTPRIQTRSHPRSLSRAPADWPLPRNYRILEITGSVLSDAARESLSLSVALEWLVDRELQARNVCPSTARFSRHLVARYFIARLHYDFPRRNIVEIDGAVAVGVIFRVTVYKRTHKVDEHSFASNRIASVIPQMHHECPHDATS